MLNCYRVSFDAELVYQIEYSNQSEIDGPFAVLVYRVCDDRRELAPLRRDDGKPMRFEAASRRLALALACDVLQAIHGKHLMSLVACPE